MSSHPKGRDETRPAETAGPAARGGVDEGSGPAYNVESSKGKIGTGSGARGPRPGGLPADLSAEARRAKVEASAKAGPVRRSMSDGGGPEARCLAAAILEVLGGERSPTEAAQALGTSLPRYYALESRALAGLIAGCEPRPTGRVKSPQREVETLRRENEKLKRDVGRSQALVRMAQRAAGLSAAAPHGKPAKGKRRRRPVARALRAAAEIRSVSPLDAPLQVLAPTCPERSRGSVVEGSPSSADPLPSPVAGDAKV